MEGKLIDHLFRHHSGKMVSVLTRIFGFEHLDIIEDAVQDTFLKAATSWRNEQPKNPEAWLTQAAKNRVLDIIRKLNAKKKYVQNLTQGTGTIAINELFLDNEIEDAQLRMIFTACHPKLDPRDRISFALKTISGFSIKEISSALLAKEETIKKRLVRARKAILEANLKFRIPRGKTLPERLKSVMEVLYLIFNEGFHSNSKEQLIRKDLCGEAMRLCQLLLKHKYTRTSETYALFALMCFHSARLESKINVDNRLLDLRHQDRSLWHFPLVELGNAMMHKAVETEHFSSYHYEAAIAAEHLKAQTFNETNWSKILHWYKLLHELQPMPSHKLTMAVICIQVKDFESANAYFKEIQPKDFEQRSYLFYAAKSDYFSEINKPKDALKFLDLSLEAVTNNLEKQFLLKKRAALIRRLVK